MRVTKKMGALAALALTVAGGAVTAFAHEGGGRARILERFDTNKDGKLDDAEKAAMKDQFRQMREKRHAAMLAKFDTNKDGKLDDGERKVMIDTIKAERFKKLDTNGDGVISQDEFNAGAMGHRHRFGFFGGHEKGEE